MSVWLYSSSLGLRLLAAAFAHNVLDNKISLVQAAAGGHIWLAYFERTRMTEPEIAFDTSDQCEVRETGRWSAECNNGPR